MFSVAPMPNAAEHVFLLILNQHHVKPLLFSLASMGSYAWVHMAWVPMPWVPMAWLSYKFLCLGSYGLGFVWRGFLWLGSHGLSPLAHAFLHVPYIKPMPF